MSYQEYDQEYQHKTMNKAYKEKWLKALIFGDYKQGKRALRTDNKYCCLGVICNVINPNGWVRGKNFDSHNQYAFISNKFRSASVLPENVSIRIGLSSAAMDKLTDMNDKGKDFKEIATWIDKNL